jgi:hypothetical protein
MGGRGFALCVGVEAYAAPLTNLPGVRDEVSELAAFWRRVGATAMCEFDCGRGRLRQPMLEARRQLESSAVDYFVFHFSGHGDVGAIILADSLDIEKRDLEIIVDGNNLPMFDTKPRLMLSTSTPGSRKSTIEIFIFVLCSCDCCGRRCQLKSPRDRDVSTSDVDLK